MKERDINRKKELATQDTIKAIIDTCGGLFEKAREGWSGEDGYNFLEGSRDPRGWATDITILRGNVKDRYVNLVDYLYPGPDGYKIVTYGNNYKRVVEENPWSGISMKHIYYIKNGFLIGMVDPTSVDPSYYNNKEEIEIVDLLNNARKEIALGFQKNGVLFRDLSERDFPEAGQALKDIIVRPIIPYQSHALSVLKRLGSVTFLIKHNNDANSFMSAHPPF